MFLALREIRHQRTRFGLIVAAIALVSYLAFFLSSLAFGLAHSYRATIDRWDASGVVLTDASNKNIMASRLDESQQQTAESLSDSASLVVVSGVLEKGDRRTDAFTFGVDLDSFLAPEITEGRAISDPDTEVVADHSLTQEGWSLGDSFRLSGSDHEWTIVGFSDDETFQAAPVVIADQKALLADAPRSLSPTVNAVVTRSDPSSAQRDDLSQAGLEMMDVDDFIKTLPGYQPQVLTFSLMIGSLVVIASFVLGIFVYVLTLQKREVLGILKARGVPTSYLVRSGAAQTAVLSVVGVAVGLALTVLTSLLLPDKVPFRTSVTLDAVVAAAFILFSVIGGLASVRVITRIDPVEAIS